MEGLDNFLEDYLPSKTRSTTQEKHVWVFIPSKAAPAASVSDTKIKGALKDIWDAYEDCQSPPTTGSSTASRRMQTSLVASASLASMIPLLP